MFVFAHLGIGSCLVPARFPTGMVLLGTLLPDLIDKPLFYSLYFYFDRNLTSMGLITGTRTVGHMVFLWLGLWFILSLIKANDRSLLYKNWAKAVILGALTHLFLDLATEIWVGKNLFLSLQGFFFPLLGLAFPVFSFDHLGEHLSRFLLPHLLLGEVVGAFLIYRRYRLGTWNVRPFF